MSSVLPITNGQRAISATPRRPSTSGGRSNTSSTPVRPSTSSGEVIPVFAHSLYLREALRDIGSTPARARSTTPRQKRPGFRSQSYRDEWLQSSGDEKKEKIQRQPRQRRASEISSSHATLATSHLGSREASNAVDKQDKEIWNLKHKIMLLQNSNQGKDSKIEELEGYKESFRIAQERIAELTEQKEEIMQINDELLQQMELKDHEHEQAQQAAVKDALERQSAIMEAAAMIQKLEAQKYELVTQLEISRQQLFSTRMDSDYHSGEPEQPHNQTAPPVTRTPLLGDSDYFSADTSPLVTPKTLADQVSTSNYLKTSQLDTAQHISTAFNREVGIRSQISDNSLFSSYLEDAKPPEYHSAQPIEVSTRILRLRTAKLRAPSPKSMRKCQTGSDKKQQSYALVDSRPLRNLYATGELAVQVDSDCGPVPPGALSDKSSLVSASSSSHDDTFPSGTIGGPKANSTLSAATIPTSPMTPSKSTVPSEAQSQVLSTGVDRKRSRTLQPLVRQNTTPTMMISKAKPSPVRAMSERRGSADDHRPRNLVSTRSAHSKSPRSPNCPLQFGECNDSSKIQSAQSESKNSIPLISPTYATPQAQTAPTYSSVKPTTKTHRSPPTPNFSHWPRRYPAWPPSAGLVNRDLLFHGEGMDEMFPTDSEASP